MILLKAYFSLIVKSSYQKILFVVNLCTEYFFHLDVYAVWALWIVLVVFALHVQTHCKQLQKWISGGLACIYIYMYIYIYLFIYIYTYIYICISTSTTDPRWLEHTLGAPSPRFYSLDNGLASRDALPHPWPWVPWVPWRHQRSPGICWEVFLHVTNVTKQRYPMKLEISMGFTMKF